MAALIGNTGALVSGAYAIGVEAALERPDDAGMTDLAAFADALPPVAASPAHTSGRSRGQTDVRAPNASA